MVTSTAPSASASQAGGVPEEPARGLDLDRHVGQLMLQGLEVADGHAELLASLGVLDTHGDATVAMPAPAAAQGTLS